MRLRRKARVCSCNCLRFGAACLPLFPFQLGAQRRQPFGIVFHGCTHTGQPIDARHKGVGQIGRMGDQCIHRQRQCRPQPLRLRLIQQAHFVTVFCLACEQSQHLPEGKKGVAAARKSVALPPHRQQFRMLRMRLFGKMAQQRRLARPRFSGHEQDLSLARQC